MKLSVKKEQDISRRLFGEMLIEIRKKRYITLPKLAKYFGVHRDYAMNCHAIACNLNFYHHFIITNHKGVKTANYEPTQETIVPEPEFMANAQTRIEEPTNEIDFSTLPPTTDWQAFEYMRNKF